MQTDPALEFSRIIAFDQIGSTGVTYHIEAKEEECQRLAQRFELVAIHSLRANFSLSPAEEAGCYRIEGTVKGDVVQSCVSTLKDVPAHVEADFHILLRPSHSENREKEFEIDLADETDTEYYTEASIDLGETAAQYLYLNLDPFPRAPDAPDFGEKQTDARPNPFAQALKGLKKEK